MRRYIFIAVKGEECSFYDRVEECEIIVPMNQLCHYSRVKMTAIEMENEIERRRW